MKHANECSCWSDYPNKMHKVHKNGKRLCDYYDFCEKIPFYKCGLGKTHCTIKPEYKGKDWNED